MLHSSEMLIPGPSGPKISHINMSLSSLNILAFFSEGKCCSASLWRSSTPPVQAGRMWLTLGAAALLHNHILDVLLDDLLLLVVVQHGHGSQARWDAAGMQVLEGAVAPHAVVADDCGVEGQRGAGEARRV